VRPFPKPRSDYDYELDAELAGLRAHKRVREIPARTDGLLIATWNVANFGVQERREKDLALIAEMMGWFDLVTVQEVANDLSDLYAVRELIRGPRELMISDTAGNDERAAFVYDPRKVERRELVGRLSIPPSDRDRQTTRAGSSGSGRDAPRRGTRTSRRGGHRQSPGSKPIVQEPACPACVLPGSPCPGQPTVGSDLDVSSRA
jgi:hypothetical protein